MFVVNLKYPERRFGQIPSQTIIPAQPSPLTYVPPGAAWVITPGILGKWEFMGGPIWNSDVRGEFEIWQEEGQYKGKIKFLLPKVTDWMPLQNLTFDERTSTVKFYSPLWEDYKVPTTKTLHDLYYYPAFIVAPDDWEKYRSILGIFRGGALIHLAFALRGGETIALNPLTVHQSKQKGVPAEVFKGPLIWEGNLMGQLMRLNCSWFVYSPPPPPDVYAWGGPP
ncbi:MAG: hypothetical protein K6T87_15955 [Roseiflexus sp.]|uniref:hypothetical protein n=1 Tax=Roseiflexus sp. TaxID=2562120 RepID=UPI0025DEC6ED|nr:hypothetical protein [Roseiflexus sp.]MCL6542050.1 hypothetical protein [Roseiflexus sp.]